MGLEVRAGGVAMGRRELVGTCICPESGKSGASEVSKLELRGQILKVTASRFLNTPTAMMLPGGVRVMLLELVSLVAELTREAGAKNGQA